MSKTPTNYAELEAAGMEVSQRVTNLSERLKQTVAALKQIEGEMIAMTQAAPVGYLGVTQHIQSVLSENPKDEDYIAFQRRWSRAVTDFMASRETLTRKIAAFEATV